MDLQPRGYEKVIQLVEKGASIPNPLSLDIGDEVDVDRISGDGVVLYPGCRIYGSRTVVSAGVRLGAEAPVTVDDCRLGPLVELKGGYFKRSVFLEKATMGSGAQVREGCLLEEEAGGAHCVGLKQTILFPFVTLGSLINFCDCLMAGGTSRKDHSEVGSSYIHFNFTPDGDKTTPSLFGDVPRGVMLDQAPIFLGGQGGSVGPVRVGFGTVIAAGSILRDDVLEDGKLVIDGVYRQARRNHVPYTYGNLARLVGNNLVFLANLSALEHWYREVRRGFFERSEFGPLVYEGALEMLTLAKKERAKRLRAMSAKVRAKTQAADEFRERVAEVCALFEQEEASSAAKPIPADLQAAVRRAAKTAAPAGTGGYVAFVKSLEPEVAAQGVAWLQSMVTALCREAGEVLPSMKLFV